MKKVIIINENMSDNLGDQAISQSLKNKILDLGFECESAPFSTLSPQIKIKRIEKGNMSFFRVYSSLLIWIMKIFPIALSYANKKFDYAIIGGGQLLLSNNKFPLALLIWILCLKLKKTRVSIIGVGCGDKFNKLEILCLKFALKYVDSIIVRDEKSKNNIKFFFGFNSILSFDVAYEEKTEKTEKTENNILLVSIIDFSIYKRYENESPYEINNKEEYYNSWLNEIRVISPEEIIFMSTTITDTMETENFVNLFKNELCKYKIVNEVSLNDYLKIQSQCHGVLSARMHALILGENCGLKIYPWLVSSKIIEYCNNQSKEKTKYKSNHVIKKIKSILTCNE
ncbi:polysaccharide pyruvyl transferase family protein [Providencia rettgeri]|uniref:polysaccharide pyruvyl transferase family protein n=1 Tax=Providencia rettgeri TaxID=587 RepID=UPI00065E2187|nr:polysaccharide pyruvyl transferase family protein [Providencia rettgeri]